MKSPTAQTPLLIGCSLGNCVHIAGVAGFFRLAEDYGFPTLSLGPAVDPSVVVEALLDNDNAVGCVSYRLSRSAGQSVLEEFRDRIRTAGFKGRLLFGGTPETVALAKEMDLFHYYFTGDEPPEQIDAVLRWLMGGDEPQTDALMDNQRPPIWQALGTLPSLGEGRRMPLLRHHFGLPDLDETVNGVEAISQAGVVDVISLAPDQNAQESFFRPEEYNPALDGAGGCPIRSKADLVRLDQARQCGNRPYLRIYSGTRDLVKWADLSIDTIDNAWGAVPLCWYSELDRRSKRPLEQAIQENLEAIQYYASRNRPVEVLESHQWSLRNAPDTTAAAMAYIGAYAAKKAGVRYFIAQFMFNTPRFTSIRHDLAKMFVKLALIHTLADDDFLVFRQVRAGLAHFSPDLDIAKGQLGMITTAMLALHPHIVHVVSFTEADHAATAKDVIQSTKLVRGVIRNCSLGMPDLFADPRVQEQARNLMAEVRVLLGTIHRLGLSMGSSDPFADPAVLAASIRNGLLDAPHLSGCLPETGRIRTGPANGGCVAIDQQGRPLLETARIKNLVEAMGLDIDAIGSPPPLLDGEEIHRFIEHPDLLTKS